MTPARWDRPGRLLSLWEIMNLFNAKALMMTVAGLEANGARCRTDMQHGREAVDIDKFKRVVRVVEGARDFCRQSGFDDAAQALAMQVTSVWQPRSLMKKPMTSSEVEGHLRTAFNTILSDLNKRRFLRVETDRSGCVDQPLLFGEVVAEAFPAARFDIIESGNCLAAECNTAAVFHMMRVVEWGLRDFCAQLGFRQVAIDRKRGKFAPVEYAQWEKIIGQLHEKIDALVDKIKNKRKKQEAQEFYYPALQDIRAIKDAWRNHVMHTRREYTREDADAIGEHVKQLMSALAARP
jgi:hypothetical protein